MARDASVAWAVFYSQAEQSGDGIVNTAACSLDDAGRVRDLAQDPQRLGGTSLDRHRVLAHRHDAPHPR